MKGVGVIVLVALVFLLVLRQQQQQQQFSAAPAPGNPNRGPEALYDPSTGQGGLSTRQQIETGVGTAVGAGAGLYLCSGNPLCATGGAYIGGVAAPFVSHGAQSAWNATLGRLF